ncbi:site-specific recombinase resolvase, partial [Ralstonia nicotianae]
MTGGALETFVPVAFRRRGARRVVADDRTTHDTTLLQALA